MNIRSSILTSLGFVLALPLSQAIAAPTFQLNDVGPYEGVTTDIFDVAQGNQVIFTTQQHTAGGGSDPRSAFGYFSNFVGGEQTRTIFLDGPGTSFVDIIEWQTAGWFDVSSLQLRLQDDGNAYRSALEYKLFGSQDGMAFSQISAGVMPRNGSDGYATNGLLITDNALTGTTTALRSFRLELPRASNGGTRVVELDAFGTQVPQPTTYLDRLAFNAASNLLTTNNVAMNDEAPGLVQLANIAASSVLFGSDSKEDAFGNNNGGVEPSSFLFEDGGTVDNGDLVLGNFGETVDSIDWHTDQPLTLAGFAIALGGEGGPGNNRGAELVRFLVEGNQVALFDANATGGIVSHLFSGGNVTGDDFRIEFTRSSTSGTRVGEIDAILGIPEPTAALSLLLGAGVVALRRRRAEPRA